jgi:hypothetical protein
MRKPRGLSEGAENRLLIAFLGATGVALGAGLFELRVVIPQWASAPAAGVRGAMERSGHVASGRVFWPFVGAAVLPLTAANVLAAAWSRAPRRRWWLASSATVAGLCGATAYYYVPALHRLTRAEQMSEDEVRSLVVWRVRLDYVRVAVGAGAWICGLTALSRHSNG